MANQNQLSSVNLRNKSCKHSRKHGEVSAAASFIRAASSEPLIHSSVGWKTKWLFALTVGLHSSVSWPDSVIFIGTKESQTHKLKKNISGTMHTHKIPLICNGEKQTELNIQFKVAKETR